MTEPRVWVRKVWFWWVALNPDEVIGLFDTSTRYYALSRERAVEKCRRAFSPKPSKWEEV
jgi:hypothetical protein